MKPRKREQTLAGYFASSDSIGAFLRRYAGQEEAILEARRKGREDSAVQWDPPADPVLRRAYMDGWEAGGAESCVAKGEL